MEGNSKMSVQLCLIIIYTSAWKLVPRWLRLGVPIDPQEAVQAPKKQQGAFSTARSNDHDPNDAGRQSIQHMCVGDT